METDYNFREVPGLVCHFCPNKLGGQRDDTIAEEIAISLKNIFQYLNVDLFREGHDKTGEVLAAGLCQECSSIVNLFGGIFQDFETARLLLIGCLQKFTERLERRSTFSEEIGRRGGDAGRWNAEILKYCHIKLQATPKDELDRAMSEIANDKLDDDPNNDSSMDGVEESERREVPNIYEAEAQSGDIPDGNISSTLEKNPTVSSFYLHNDFVPTLEGSRNHTGVKTEAESHAEVLQILDINQSLIRRLSDVVTRQSQSRARKLELTTIKQEEEEGVTTQFKCLHCGVSSATAQGNKTHMMLVHTMNYFSFPVGTTEADVVHVVSSLLKEGLSKAGEGRVNCKFCGGVQCTNSMRHHLLKYHADLLMSELSPSPDRLSSNSHPPPQRNSNKNQLGKKIQIVRSSHQALLQRLRQQNAGNGVSSGVTKVKCQLCGKLCTSKNGLRIHKSKVHMGSSSGQNKGHHHHHHEPLMKAIKKFKTCLYCGKTLTQEYSQDHVLQVHFFEYFANRLPQYTSKDEFKDAIRITQKSNLRGDHHAFQCRLCSRVCSATSKRIHLLRMHFDAVLTTLRKSLTQKGNE